METTSKKINSISRKIWEGPLSRLIHVFNSANTDILYMKVHHQNSTIQVRKKYIQQQTISLLYLCKLLSLKIKNQLVNITSSTKNIRKNDNLYISKLKIFLIKMHEGSTIKRNTDHTCFYMNLE